MSHLTLKWLFLVQPNVDSLIHLFHFISLYFHFISFHENVFIIYLLTFKSFQTSMIFFLLLNKKEGIYIFYPYNK